ncbi:MAG: hypothetical protein JJ974_07420 [Phycisphaerales bacterium]|nr:hypothetical protein [Phycisphaerales bacterium]
MHQQRISHHQFLGAIAFVGLAVGVCFGYETPEQSAERSTDAVETEQSGEGVQGNAESKPVSEIAFEWVEITIHMPDGRVIHTKERRYPSRSRVYQLTGKLPVVRRGSAAPAASPSGSNEMMTVLVEGETVPVADGPNSGLESLGDVGSLVDGLIGAVGDSESLNESISDLGVDLGSVSELGSGTSGGTASGDTSSSVVVDQDNGRSVRVFKKSS